MTIDDAAVAATIGRLSQHEFGRMGIREALELVVESMPVLFSVDGAGILLLDDQQALRMVAASDGAAQVLEAVQETTGRGPCVAALIEDTVVEVNDVATDGRWPNITSVLVENGIRGIMGVPIHVTGAPVGSVNVYSREAKDWDKGDRDALLAFDRLIERILSHAVYSEGQDEVVRHLERALACRINIDRAVGMVMGLYEMDAADAFERIRRAARSSRRPIEEVAAAVLDLRKLP